MWYNYAELSYCFEHLEVILISTQGGKMWRGVKSSCMPLCFMPVSIEPLLTRRYPSSPLQLSWLFAYMYKTICVWTIYFPKPEVLCRQVASFFLRPLSCGILLRTGQAYFTSIAPFFFLLFIIVIFFNNSHEAGSGETERWKELGVLVISVSESWTCILFPKSNTEVSILLSVSTSRYKQVRAGRYSIRYKEIIVLWLILPLTGFGNSFEMKMFSTLLTLFDTNE